MSVMEVMTIPIRCPSPVSQGSPGAAYVLIATPVGEGLGLPGPGPSPQRSRKT